MDNHNFSNTQLSPPLRTSHASNINHLLARLQANSQSRSSQPPSRRPSAISIAADSPLVATPNSQISQLFERLAPTTQSSSIFVEDGHLDGPPLKRQKLGDIQQKEVQHGDEEYAPSSDPTAQPCLGSPLPSLSDQGDTSKRALSVRSTNSRKSLAERAAHGTNAPLVATRLPAPRTVADFAPWAGRHPEDIMSDAVIKAGYFDKGTGQNESSSARPSLWPNLSLKNNMCLQTLSHLFSSSLEKRQIIGKTTAPSTFKPPPRVTVTDTKREAWLRDLANPKIALRKQSRTIPHGIRGKLLMDQCLAKNVPLPRAVWLAKCVGANELRAFRRKGVAGAAAASGEFKWIREWTMAVEQFLESVVTACGQPDWQARMNYAVRLVMHFYVANLLDRPQFLDWIVVSFASSNPQSVPIWIIMTQVYWKDLIRSVSRGRKLASCLLARLHDIKHMNTPDGLMLRDRLQRLVNMLAAMNRACLVLPRIWPRYGYLLQPGALPYAGDTRDSITQNIIARNERLCNSDSSVRSRHPLLELYQVMDDTISAAAINYQATVKRVTHFVKNDVILVRGIVSWATSVHRTGIARVYVAAKMVRTLISSGCDAESIILDLLQDIAFLTDVDPEYMQRLVRHLIGLHAFSIGRYLQRLITSTLLDQIGPTLAADLLSILPPHEMQPQTKNLRRTLMLRRNIKDAYSSVDQDFVHGLQALLRDDDAATPVIPDCPSLAEKFALVTAISDCLRSVENDSGPGLNAFCFVRDAFVLFDEKVAISSLLDMCHSPHATLLATMADTVRFCADELSVLDCFDSSTKIIFEHYRTLRTHCPLDRSLVLSMIVLSERSSSLQSLKASLENDLLVCDQQITSMVCSPASDSLVNVQASVLDVEDDIDNVFASGNVMDQNVMERVYERLLAGTNDKICVWLQQLRVFDAIAFGNLVNRTVHDYLSGSDDQITPRILVVLVASYSTTLQSVIGAVTSPISPSSAAKALALLSVPDKHLVFLRSSEKLRYRIAQDHVSRSHAVVIKKLFAAALEDSSFDLLGTEGQALFERHVLTDGEHIVQSGNLSVIAYANVSKLVRSIVTRNTASDEENSSSPEMIMRIATPLSIKVCTRALQLMTIPAVQSTESTKRTAAVLIHHITEDDGIWPELIAASNGDVQRAIHEWAHSGLLSDRAEDDAATDRYLQVMSLTIEASRAEDTASTLSVLVDRIRNVERQFVERAEAGMLDDVKQRLMQNLSITARIVALHINATDESEPTKQGRGALLTALCAILALPQLQTQTAVLEITFDLASVLSDSLSDTIMATVQQAYQSSNNRNALVESALNVTSHQHGDPRLVLNVQTAPVMPQPRALSRNMPQAPTPQAILRSGIVAARGATQDPQRQMSTITPILTKPTQDAKSTPFTVRSWEMIPDPTPVMGENDGSLSLSLFAARKVL